MRLHELLPEIDVLDVQGDVHREVTRVSRDSRDVDRHTLFVAVRGARVDTHELVSGLSHVAAVFVERTVQAAPGVPVVRVRDARAALARAAAVLAGRPAERMRVIGITGTKGKTTTAALIEGALRYAGRRVGRIGTTGTIVDGTPVLSDLTTPDSPELQALLARMLAAGVSDVAMEVSSIGLVQRRVDAIPFHFAMFTNLGHDHLDFHGTAEAYGEAKARLFRELLREPGGAPRAAVCGDDAAHERLGAPSDTWRFGSSSGCDFRIEDLRAGPEGIVFGLRTPVGRTEVRSALIGRHNALNLAGAAAACVAVGCSLDEAVAGLQSVSGVSGRLEAVPNTRGLLVLVDYAHTPESLEAVLRATRDVTKGRLWLVFGCGGDRDSAKRPMMGDVASRLADRAVVTSDNPRSEDPQRIIDSILSGMEKRPVYVDCDRARAIEWTVENAAPGDCILIAGKGHETYQEIAGTKKHFDDREVARSALELR